MSKELAKVEQVSIEMTSRGVQLQSIEEMFRFSKAVVAAGFAPSGMNESAVLIAIQMGAELGLPPMASLQNIAVVNGRPTVWGDAVSAICMNSGVFDHEAYREEIKIDDSGFPMEASCTVRRKGGQPVTRTFTMSQAKRAGLMGKKGPWTNYPERMLQMRARNWAMRDAFPDFLRGFYIADRESGVMVDGPPPVEEIKTPQRTPTLEDLTANLTRDAAGDYEVYVTIDGEVVSPEEAREMKIRERSEQG